MFFNIIYVKYFQVTNTLFSPNSANTLSLFYRPGEDKRLLNTNSDSIFTFGDFRIYQDNSSHVLTGTSKNISFDSFSTLETLGTANFTPPQSYSVNYNELNLIAADPLSYSYFGSFYTEVANSINNIIEKFPYALLSYDHGTGVTIYDYTTIWNSATGDRTATFKIPYSALTNQGNIIINSGSTSLGTFSLVDNFDQFGIQVSAVTSGATTISIKILSYYFSAASNQYLFFEIDDFLEDISGSVDVVPIWIRPSNQRFAEYKHGISKLEWNLLYGQKLNVPNVYTDSGETSTTFVWPTSIDGFAPDSFGAAFDAYKNDLLKAAVNIDDAKTNIMLKTMIPETYTDNDSSNQIYKSTVQAYAHEFDQIKKYIDGIAYAHSLEYNGEESVPNKFLFKFSNLLGWKLTDAFNEIDLFEYLAGDADGNGTSYSKFNLEVWRRILININWLYKKKGTRDAIQFIFKLLGAPDCLVQLDEFVYKINSVAHNANSGTGATIAYSPKINSNGYIDYSQSQYAFQEGGPGKGNGQLFINQWTPEFNPNKTIDNTKIALGFSGTNGSEDTINSKELRVSLDSAAAIECDALSFYQSTGTTFEQTLNPWVWGSDSPLWSANTVPYEILVSNTIVNGGAISAMTLTEWVSFLYANLINPRDRKTQGQPMSMFTYPNLRNAYLTYYYWADPVSHRLTFKRLEGFLNLIERNFTDYTSQLMPATTILETTGTVVRNTVFSRQKFVYKEGINLGSEFKKKILPDLISVINPVELSTKVNDFVRSRITQTIITGTFKPSYNLNIAPYSLNARLVTVLEGTIQSARLSAYTEISQTTITP